MSAKLTLGYCPVGNGSYIEPFDEIFGDKKNIIDSLEGVDAVVFWGGTDIHPSLYKQPAHHRNQVAAFPEPTIRDHFERHAMLYCSMHDIPMIGVCRGAQLMTVFAGGSLIQDVTGHSGEHDITTSDGRIFKSTSCHHQMFNLKGTKHELLAWSTENLSRHYEDGFGNVELPPDFKEPEVVFFPEIRGLAIQGHPEWATGSLFAEYCNQLIRTKLLRK